MPSLHHEQNHHSYHKKNESKHFSYSTTSPRHASNKASNPVLRYDALEGTITTHKDFQISQNSQEKAVNKSSSEKSTKSSSDVSIRAMLAQRPVTKTLAHYEIKRQSQIANGAKKDTFSSHGVSSSSNEKVTPDSRSSPQPFSSENNAPVQETCNFNQQHTNSSGQSNSFHNTWKNNHHGRKSMDNSGRQHERRYKPNHNGFKRFPKNRGSSPRLGQNKSNVNRSSEENSILSPGLCESPTFPVNKEDQISLKTVFGSISTDLEYEQYEKEKEQIRATQGKDPALEHFDFAGARMPPPCDWEHGRPKFDNSFMNSYIEEWRGVNGFEPGPTGFENNDDWRGGKFHVQNYILVPTLVSEDSDSTSGETDAPEVSHTPKTTSEVGHESQTTGNAGHAPQTPGKVGNAPQGTDKVGHTPQSTDKVGHTPQSTGKVGNTPQSTGKLVHASQTPVKLANHQAARHEHKASAKSKTNQNKMQARPTEVVQSGPENNSFSPKIQMYLRPAVIEDSEQVAQIYNKHIAEGNITEDQEPILNEDAMHLIKNNKKEKLPFIVAVAGRCPIKLNEIQFKKQKKKFSMPKNEKIIGFAFNERFNYSFSGSTNGRSRYTTTLQVFVAHEYQGKGVGRNLLDRLIHMLSTSYGYQKACEFINPEGDEVHECEGSGMWHQIQFHVPVLKQNDPDYPRIKNFLFSNFLIREVCRMISTGRTNIQRGPAKWLDTVIFQFETSQEGNFGPYS